MNRNDSPKSGSGKRGRPQKFGRPSQLVAITLPEDVLRALRSVHRDIGWAIVQLVEPLRAGRPAEDLVDAPDSSTQLAMLPGNRALIVVDPTVLRHVKGVETIPLSDGRAFMALDGFGGIANLEMTLLDRIDELEPEHDERKSLQEIYETVRNWRRSRGLKFTTKSIIVAENVRGQSSAPLARIQSNA